MTKKNAARALPSGGGSFLREKSGRLKKEAGTSRPAPGASALAEEPAPTPQETSAPARGKSKENDNG